MTALIAQGPIVELAGAVLLLLVAALVWLWPRPGRPALGFSRADVQFLFTAPITRRRLIQYKVLRSQLGTLFGSALMTLFVRPTSVAGGWTIFLGLSLVVAILNLHLTGVSLSRAGSSEPGDVGIVPRWLPQAVVAGAALVLTGTLATHWADLVASAGRGDLVAQLERLGTTGIASVALWPFRAIARLPLAPTAAAFVAALPWALAMLALHYAWVQSLDVPFEEASAEWSEKITRLRQGRSAAAPRQRPGPVATPFALSIEGRPETAILWKNLILMGRFPVWKLLMRVVPLVIMLGVVMGGAGRRGGLPSVLVILCLMTAAFTLIIGPQIVRNDLRQDLANLAVLKTWPIRGATLVRGEVLAPALALTLIVSVALLGAAVMSTLTPFSVNGVNRWALLLAVLLVAPGIILAQLLVQNALAVSFPSWVAIGAPRGGVDVMGQRLIMMVANLLALLVIVLPAAIVAGLAGLAYYGFTGTIPLVLPAIVAAVALQAEAFVGSEIVGAILDRTDISAVDAPES